jgi:hypothetical protein
MKSASGGLSMKPVYLLLPIAALLVLLALLAGRRGGTSEPGGFTTPEDCVLAHAEACRYADVTAYLDCLTGPLLDQARQLEQSGELPGVLRRTLAGVKSFVLVGPAAVEADSAIVEADLVRPEGTRRSRFRLRQTAFGWRIVAIDAPRDIHAPVRYGTHVSDAGASGE